MACCCVPLNHCYFLPQGMYFWWRDGITVTTISLRCQINFFVYKVFYAYASSVVITARFNLVNTFKFSMPFKNTISDCVYLYLTHKRGWEHHSTQLCPPILCLLFQWQLIIKLSLYTRKVLRNRKLKRVEEINWLTRTWPWTSINYIIPT